MAEQTIWYGLSSVFARFLYYLLTPYLTIKLTSAAYGEMSLVYALIPFLNVMFSYGIETAYFRFIQKDSNKKEIYNTASVSLIGSTLFLTLLMIAFRSPIAGIISIKEHPEYITWSALIIAFDTLAVIPMAKLRQERRPVKFAMVRIAGIMVNIATIIFFLSVCPALKVQSPDSIWLKFYDEKIGVGYVIIANVAGALVSLLLLAKELLSFRFQFNKRLWKEMMIYSFPLIIVGFGGVINEVFDRIMLGWWVPAASSEAAKAEVGTYSACYKLSILITLFVQAFRMGAEPFFFQQSTGENPQRVYARVMKFFVITISVIFLAVALFLDVWKYFISNPVMWEGLKIVPILLLANMFLGIYYNLSIWYKLTNRTIAGAQITFIGVAITLLINYLFIPSYSYMACAWATFFSYGTMMAISFLWGQKAYYIPYAWKKLTAFIVIVVLLYFVHRAIAYFWTGTWPGIVSGLLLLVGYAFFITRIEKNEFRKLPVIGKYV